MNIAIHQPRASYFLGGAEATSIEIAKMLSKNNKISFVTSNNPLTSNFKNLMENYPEISYKFIDSFPCEEFKEFPPMNKWDFEGIVFGERSKRYYDKNNFDIILVFYSGDMLTLNNSKSPAILHMQGYPREYKIFDEINYSKAIGHIACSNYVKSKMEELFNIKGVEIFYSMPDLKKFKSKNIEKSIDVAYIGRLTERKGAEVLINSIKLMEDEIQSVVIAGKGDIDEKLKNLVQELKLESKIKFVGPIQQEEVISLLDKAKIFVLPATSREPFPKSILEALSMGTIVISTSVGGIPEMIKDGENGILVEPKEPIALKEAISNLIRESEKREYLKERGFKYLEKNFNYEEKIKELEKIYRKILDNSKNGKN